MKPLQALHVLAAALDSIEAGAKTVEEAQARIDAMIELCKAASEPYAKDTVAWIKILGAIREMQGMAWAAYVEQGKGKEE